MIKKVVRTPIEKFTQHVMLRGKKSIAQKIVFEAFEEMKKKGIKDPQDTFTKAIENVTPAVEVRARRIGGSNYQIPMEVSPSRRETLPVRWIIDAARNRKGMSMSKALANELIEAANNEGAAIKKKEDTHRMAEANKAFAHFARYA